MLSTNTNVYLIQILTASFNSSLLFLSTFFLISKKNKLFLIYDKNSRSHNLLPRTKRRRRRKEKKSHYPTFQPYSQKTLSTKQITDSFSSSFSLQFPVRTNLRLATDTCGILTNVYQRPEAVYRSRMSDSGWREEEEEKRKKERSWLTRPSCLPFEGLIRGR